MRLPRSGEWREWLDDAYRGKYRSICAITAMIETVLDESRGVKRGRFPARIYANSITLLYGSTTHRVHRCIHSCPHREREKKTVGIAVIRILEYRKCDCERRHWTRSDDDNDDDDNETAGESGAGWVYQKLRSPANGIENGSACIQRNTRQKGKGE